MNTYNDNLRASVLESLDSQELQRKKMKSRYNASIFKLYYAQGAKIKATEKLEIAKDALEQKANVKVQAVKNNNIATNVLMASNQEKTYVEQSVSNAAVCAVNVQVAANAIVRLASDIASINSIANVADFDTEISNPYNNVFKLIGTTAYNAELASQWAMEASELTAIISANTVNSVATLTDPSVKNLLKVASSQFNTLSETVTADNEVVASSSTKEKSAEGNLEDTHVDYQATIKSYNITNNELNLDLTVDSFTPTGYHVNFNLIKSSFKKPTEEDAPNGFYNLTDPPLKHPADYYYAILVKEEKKATFSLALAEHLLQNTYDKKRFYKIEIPKENSTRPIEDPSQIVKIGDTISCPIRVEDLPDTDGETIKLGQNYVVFIVAEFNKVYKKMVNNFEDFISAPSFPFSLTRPLSSPNYEDFCYKETYNIKSEAAIEQTKNNIFDKETALLKLEEEKRALEVEEVLNIANLKKLEIELSLGIGNKTVLKKNITALTAEIEKVATAYKKTIERIISSNEELDVLNEKLHEDEPKTFCTYKCDDDGCDEQPNENKHNLVFKDATFSFHISPNTFNSQGKAQFRCMFLPYSDRLIKDLLNTEGLKNVEAEAILIKDLNENANAKIQIQEKEIKDFEKVILEFEIHEAEQVSKILILEESLSLAKTAEERKNITHDIENANKILTAIKNIIEEFRNVFISNAQHAISEIKDNLAKDIASINFNVDNEKNGLFFNLQLAEQVTAGNYSPAKPLMIPLISQSDDDTVKSNPKLPYQVIFNAETTDNFGNPLVVGDQYVPVVLAISNASENEAVKYASSISEFNTITPFTYGQFAKKQ